MKVVISIIALILFVLLARFVYLRVTNVTPPVQETILPVPSPSYFPVYSPTPAPSASPKVNAKVTPKPTATNSGKIGSLPQTGSNDMAFVVLAAGIGLFGLRLRAARS